MIKAKLKWGDNLTVKKKLKGYPKVADNII